MGLSLGSPSQRMRGRLVQWGKREPQLPQIPLTSHYDIFNFSSVHLSTLTGADLSQGDGIYEACFII